MSRRAGRPVPGRRRRSVRIAAAVVVAAIGLGVGLAAVSSGGPGGARSSGVGPGGGDGSESSSGSGGSSSRSGGSSSGSGGSSSATESAGLACSDFGSLYAALQENVVTPEELSADLTEVALQASAAAAAAPRSWGRLAGDAAALDRDVAGDSKAAGADATALAEQCSVFDQSA